MQWQERFRRARAEWMLLTFYERFEQVVILILTGLIALVVVFAVWNLALKIFHAVLAPQSFDPTDYSVFQAIFGAIFTVIIALEFKRSLLVVAERQESIVQVRTVILIALLAIVRKYGDAVGIAREISEHPPRNHPTAHRCRRVGAVHHIIRVAPTGSKASPNVR